MDPGESSEGREDEEEEGEPEKPHYEWDLNLRTLVTTAAASGVSDTLGVVEIDPSDRVLATAGIARKIRVYRLGNLVGAGNATASHFMDHSDACEYYICTPAKLSSLRWRPESGGRVVGAGDYDGVVTEYDLERRTAVFERDEHGGRRVWGVDYSKWSPAVGASCSDDGTVQVWDSRGGAAAVAAVCPGGGRPSPVCCVEFDPADGSTVAAGSADRNAYLYDARKMGAPLAVFSGHRKTVTYVRYVTGGAVVTAAADGRLKQWSMTDARAVRTYRGHANVRRFVGMSAWRSGGLLACGSESNEVYVYDLRWGRPVWVRRFDDAGELHCQQGGFVSGVSWKQACEDECTLVAGGSEGVLQVFVGRRRPISK